MTNEKSKLKVILNKKFSLNTFQQHQTDWNKAPNQNTTNSRPSGEL
jgi:hypothetical protein